MKSLFKSWKKKDPKSPHKKLSSQTEVEPTVHTNLIPEPLAWPSASPTPSKSSTSSVSPTNALQVPSFTVDCSASSSKDTMSSLEDTPRYLKSPSRLSPDSYYSYHHCPSQRYYDIPRGSPVHNAPPNPGHGPPRNAKHGPPNILQAQLSSINSSKGDHVALRGPHHSFLTSLPPHRQVQPTGSVKPRTPTRVKFDPSIDTMASRTAKVSFSDVRHLQEGLQPQQRRENSWTGHDDKKSLATDSQHETARQVLSSSANTTFPASVERITTPPNGLTLHHSSQSSPHLPARSERQHIDQEDLSALFPSPPPLIIRKKVPQPLVLQSRSPPLLSVAFPPSPNPSSTDSTPVSTPTSARMQSSTPTPTQSPILKAPFLRHGNTIPPLLYEAPTSPLPSPPVNPQSKQFAPRQATYSPQGRTHLRGVMSTSSLRPNAFSSPPTHRMTSSDPIADALQQPTKDKTAPYSKSADPRGSEAQHDSLASSQDPHVHWGYAF